MSKTKLTLSVITVIFILVLNTCEDSKNDDDDQLQSEDREKFVGNWAGTYECGVSVPDTMFIWLGASELDFNIVIHAHAMNPDTVSGELSTLNVITVPEQSMGGYPGTAKVTYSNGNLSYSQTGFGMTCGGTNYTKF